MRKSGVASYFGSDYVGRTREIEATARRLLAECTVYARALAGLGHLAMTPEAYAERLERRVHDRRFGREAIELLTLERNALRSRIWRTRSAELLARTISLRSFAAITALAMILIATQARKPAGQSARGTEFRDCPECPVMVTVPAGSFTMGSPPSERDRFANEGPQRTVTILRPFAVGKFEITFTEWEACAAGGGCQANKSPRDQGWGRATRPVINVSWHDARQYVDWLSLKTGKPYRLLTEAEWEYAARAGTTTVYWWGDEVGQNNANCRGCKSQWDGSQTAPAGSFKPNAFGIHDMLGNVWEWVQDCFGDYTTAPSDGTAVSQSTCPRVLRGGSWYLDPKSMRVASRFRFGPDERLMNGGFRVARDLPPVSAN